MPDPATAPELFDGVLMRRVLAYLIDVAILTVVAALVAALAGVLGFMTFGLTWLALPLLIVAAVLGYYAATLGGPNRATIGMAIFDLVLVPTRDYPLDGWRILVHPLVFWVTVWICWPISLGIALFTPRRQMVHDLLAGTLMLRRAPMTRHWTRRGAGR